LPRGALIFHLGRHLEIVLAKEKLAIVVQQGFSWLIRAIPRRTMPQRMWEEKAVAGFAG
jgi:hypothetical protein